MAKKAKKNDSKKQKLTVAERQRRVVNLYKACGSVRTVAERLKEAGISISKSTVANDINFVFAELQKDTLKDALHIRTLQYQRYSSLIAVFWGLAVSQDMAAAYFCLKAMDKINDIFGLKAPKEHKIETHNIQMTLAEWKENKETRTAAAAETLAMFEDDENE